MVWIFLLVLLPIIEIELLVRLTQATSVSFTVLYLLVSAIVGGALVRHQGRQAWREMQLQLRQGRAAANSWSDRLLIVLAGALLIVPGVLSDAVGLMLLIPPCRLVARRWLGRQFSGRLTVQSFGRRWTDAPSDSPRNDDEQIIDVPSRPVEQTRLN